MDFVKPKKSLGQHFLKDENIAKKIVDSLSYNDYTKVLEVGPGMGVLTKYLIPELGNNLKIIEVDRESISYLNETFPQLEKNLIYGDFLKINISDFFNENFAVIGNFPYNISTQILFKVLENKDLVPEVVGMFQKEVAQRIASPYKCKEYGVMSVLLQAFYNIEYLFTVSETVFIPPPKVKSAVIRLVRKNTKVNCLDEKMFKKVVKAAFNQRRKTLRNSLRSGDIKIETISDEILNLRPEQLSVQDFIDLSNLLV